MTSHQFFSPSHLSYAHVIRLETDCPHMSLKYLEYCRDDTRGTLRYVLVVEEGEL
jgi:hypothetical protein